MFDNMCDWQRLRSRLNHDWLKNVYLKRLDSIISQIESRDSSNENLIPQIDDALCQWRKHHEELDRLLLMAENRLSPRTFFEIEPLSQISPEHKAWLEPFTHGLWLFRSKIKEKIDNAQIILGEADKWQAKLGKNKNLSLMEERSSTKKNLEQFSDKVKALSQAISQFPDKGNVV